MAHDDLDDDTLAKAAQECLTRPSDSAMWDDRLYTSHGPVLSWAERGDDILSESNYARVLEDLQATAGEDEDDVIDATISDWLVGSLRQIFVRVRDEDGAYTAVFREATAIALALRDYPVYDESDYSARETVAFDEAVTDALNCARNRRDEEDVVLDVAVALVWSDEDLRDAIYADGYRAEDVDYDKVAAVLDRAIALASHTEGA